MGQLDAKVAIVTGATSGIGAATARALAGEGAAVVLAGRRADLGARVAGEIGSAGGEASFVATDVTDEGDVARLVAEAVRRYGQLDVAFNNAGTGGVAGPIETIDLAAFSQVLAVNVVGTFLSLKHQIPALRDGGGGSIINNASTTGVVGSRSGMAAYTAAKHGVVGLTRAAALEHGASNIRVNALVTGPVATDQLESWFEAQPERAERIIGATALGRPAEESEIAALVVFLATKGAGYITGAALAIDGGLTAG